MALITYDDKDNSLPTSNPRRLFRDIDANEIKSVVNANQNALAGAIQAAIDALIGGAPGALDTLNELAAALGDDAAFATTVINSLALKFDKATARRVRVVTGTGAIVQTDDNSLIIFNSATPFNFTLDQLTANVAGNETSKVSFINYGAGAVTFVNGSGVTAAGNLVLAGSTGTSYPTAVVIYDTLTTPRVIQGSPAANLAPYILDSVSVSTTGGTITLDLNSQIQRLFVGSASFATPKTIALSNTTNSLVLNITLNMTNLAAVLTFPTSFSMQTGDTRWNDSAHTFTPEVIGTYQFSATFNGTDWMMLVSPTPFQ